jgi:hypothetical protein
MVRAYHPQRFPKSLTTNTNNPPQGEILGVVLPLDLVPGATHAYSTRKLRSAYTGFAMKVRRSSDNATDDIPFDSNGDLDTTALLAFVGNDDGFVDTWFDQSGNGNDVIQATFIRQPQIVSAGVVLTEGASNRAVLDARSGTVVMFTAGNFGAVADISVFLVSLENGPSLGTAMRAVSIDNGPSARFFIGRRGGMTDNGQIVMQSNLNVVGGAIFELYQQASGFVELTPIEQGLIRYYQDGVSQGTTAFSYTLKTLNVPFGIFARKQPESGAEPWEGTIGEVIFYSSQEFTSRTILEDDQKTYWGTP